MTALLLCSHLTMFPLSLCRYPLNDNCSGIRLFTRLSPLPLFSALCMGPVKRVHWRFRVMWLSKTLDFESVLLRIDYRQFNCCHIVLVSLSLFPPPSASISLSLSVVCSSIGCTLCSPFLRIALLLLMPPAGGVRHCPVYKGDIFPSP